ncbi:MAG: dihydrofolate reductase family protein [Gemmatimonadota bacterium]|nr:hypothetical protein [Gemmatimonadota bacterium]MDP6529753.1 dihydrofolate reductase family protein [Gemmatimonadota bacterium]MDP6803672.1 dihydrofolate reductase family protein [Gemmatimonadota bacterium]MDP7032253.1 dihydrofolate reductase family protein [Gemmatimonadota bacterium]
MKFSVEVVCALSMDGRISTAGRDPWIWSGPEDGQWLLSRMTESDLLVAGAATIRAENPSLSVPAEWSKRRTEEGRPPQPARLILSPRLELDPACRAFDEDSAPALVAASAEAIAERGADFRGRAELLPLPDDLSLSDCLAHACSLAGGGRVVCLGGGRTNALFLEQDLVDRVSFTIAPLVIGDARAPGPFDGHGFPPEAFPRFRLEEARRLGEDLLLRYTRTPAD